jgi:hypothetical protein
MTDPLPLRRVVSRKSPLSAATTKPSELMSQIQPLSVCGFQVSASCSLMIRCPLQSVFRAFDGTFENNPPAFTCGCSGTPVVDGSFSTCNSDVADISIQCGKECPDCGPYTLVEYDRSNPPDPTECVDYYRGLNCPGTVPICSTEATLPAARPIADHPSPPDPILTDAELVAWKSMELDLYAQALKGEYRYNRVPPDIRW